MDDAKKSKSADASTDLIVSRIALPNQLPVSTASFTQEAPSKRIPSSSTVDTLLQQNEDLMARLSIQIRRSSDFEIRIHTLQERIQAAISKSQSLSDENEFLREKSRRLETQLQEQLETNKNNASYESKIEDAKLQIDQLQTFLTAAEQKNAEYEKEDLLRSAEFAELRNELNLQKQKAQLLQEQTYKYEKDLRVLSEQYREDLASLMEQSEHKERRLTDDFHKALSHLDQSKREYQILKTKYDHLSEEKIVLENRTLLAERRRDELDKKFQTEIEKFQSDLVIARAEAQTKTIQVQNLSQALSQAELKISKLNAELIFKQNETSAIHILYEQSTQDLIRLTEKSESLEKLNRQLTEGLTTQKRELEQLRAPQTTEGSETKDIYEQVISEIGDLNDIV